MNIEKHLSLKNLFVDSDNPQIERLNIIYSYLFNSIDKSFLSGDLNVNDYFRLNNNLFNNYIKNRIALVIEDSIEKEFNKQFERFTSYLK